MSQPGLQTSKDSVPSQWNLRSACSISFITLRLPSWIQLSIAISLELCFELLTSPQDITTCVVVWSMLAFKLRVFFIKNAVVSLERSSNGTGEVVWGQITFKGQLACSRQVWERPHGKSDQHSVWIWQEIFASCHLSYCPVFTFLLFLLEKHVRQRYLSGERELGKISIYCILSKRMDE